MSFRRITIFATTLRDGEQAPGIALFSSYELFQGVTVS